jgi:chorismate synthase
VKYRHDDMRNVLERASARETAARVAAGSLARQLLRELGTDVVSHVTGIGAAVVPDFSAVTYDAVRNLAADAPLRSVDRIVEGLMIAEIDRAREAGDTLGGSFEVIAHGVPVGLGSHVQWDRKLDGRLAQAIVSIPAIKAVGIGCGPAVALLPGSRVHDEILPRADRATRVPVSRPTNRAGGLEGGITNGEDLRVTGYMKPIATLMKPLRSVDLATMEVSPATVERSDVCAVPAAAVVAEAMVAWVLADAVVEKFGGDSMAELLENFRSSERQTAARFAGGIRATSAQLE